jgi:ferredoxin
MSHVIFILDGKEFCARAGERLLDVLDDEGAHELPVSCRGANCGVCRVTVLEGQSALEPPMAAERELLMQCHAQRNERLGCQICVTEKPLVHRVRLER